MVVRDLLVSNRVLDRGFLVRQQLVAIRDAGTAETRFVGRRMFGGFPRRGSSDSLRRDLKIAKLKRGEAPGNLGHLAYEEISWIDVSQYKLEAQASEYP